jgi:hypothetical protein
MWPVSRSEVKPPVIRGTVPDNYRGPLFYRWHTFTYAGYREPLQQQMILEDRNMTLRLIQNMSLYRAATRSDPGLCDSNGDLLPDLRMPIKARLRSKAYKSWPEITNGMLMLVSPRVRDVIESIEPGIHYLVPIDVADRMGGSFRTYAFFCGRTDVYPMLAPKANGIGYTLSDKGIPEFRYPEWILTSEQFGYLNRAVIGNAALLYDLRNSLLFSAELVGQLGDALPKHMCFVPMGLVDEPRLDKVPPHISA